MDRWAAPRTQSHCASGEGRNFQHDFHSLARAAPDGGCAAALCRRYLDQLRTPPARGTLFAPQRARKPSCKLDIAAAAYLCAARAKCSRKPPSDGLQTAKRELSSFV